MANITPADYMKTALIVRPGLSARVRALDPAKRDWFRLQLSALPKNGTPKPVVLPATPLPSAPTAL